ncbi:MAG: hypothetical protein ACREYF_17430 [Gammaproteobacteria bacterium]
MSITSLTITKEKTAIFNIHAINVGGILVPVEPVMERFEIDRADGMYETWSYLYHLTNDDYRGGAELTLNNKVYKLTDDQLRQVFCTLSDYFIAEEMGELDLPPPVAQ